MRQQAAKIGGSIHGAVPPAAGDFLEQRRFVVLATADPDGRPWASILTGSPGFASAPHPLEVRIHASPAPGDPLGENVETSRFAGLLAIDLATRRRMRVNGALESGADGEIVIRVEQVYSNCPKYIQRRTVEREELGGAARLVRRASCTHRGAAGVAPPGRHLLHRDPESRGGRGRVAPGRDAGLHTRQKAIAWSGPTMPAT